jgi:putative Holliday junction resolvase
MRTMALDVGDKHIGVALSDPLGILASPHSIIERRGESDDVAAIVQIVNQYQVKRIIIGLPLSLSGRVGEQAEKVHAFAEHLTKHTDIPLELRDERMTTVSAKRLMREGRNKKNRHSGRDDAVAAAVLLQSYIDEINVRQNRTED